MRTHHLQKFSTFIHFIVFHQNIHILQIDYRNILIKTNKQDIHILSELLLARSLHRERKKGNEFQGLGLSRRLSGYRNDGDGSRNQKLY